VARLIIDGMNVVGSRPTGWWRNRARAAQQFLSRLEVLAKVSKDDLTVVFDGYPQRGGPIEATNGVPVRVLYANRRGPDAADERITELVAEDAEPSSLTVVTSDRELRREVERLGARVVGASTLLQRLDEVTLDNKQRKNPHRQK
jgi:predicted RNA-binding protein with PIN domain